MNKVLVLSVSSGENEAQTSLSLINDQLGVEFEVYVIEGLSQQQAHTKLYRTIMANSEKFQWFVKVDGDMVFQSPDLLAKMISLMSSDTNIDHGVFSVMDWYTQKAIMGMHVFSGRCHWPDLNDPLFTDPSPEYPGIQKLFWESPSPVALHSPDPGLMQAFQFGFHRCLKIVQKDRYCPNVQQALFQFNLIKNLYEQNIINPDVRRKAALFGACEAIKTTNGLFESRNDFERYRHRVDSLTVEPCDIDKEICRTWGQCGLVSNIILNIPLAKIIFRSNVCRFLRVLRRVTLVRKS